MKTAPFPLNISRDQYNVDRDAMMMAARAGDLSFLDDLDRRFTGAIYDSGVAGAALESLQIDFYQRFIFLSQTTLILSDCDVESWAQPRDVILEDLLLAKMSNEDERLRIFRQVYEEILPGFPSHEYLIQMVSEADYHFDCSLLEYQPLPSAEVLISLQEDYPRPTPFEREAALYLSLSPNLVQIRQYLVEQQRCRFEPYMLAIAAGFYCKREYNYVREYLASDADLSTLPSSILSDPSDQRFLFYIDYVMIGYFQNPVEASLIWLKELFFDRVNLMRKGVRLIRFFREIANNDDDDIFSYKEFLRQEAEDENISLAKFANIAAQKLIETIDELADFVEEFPKFDGSVGELTEEMQRQIEIEIDFTINLGEQVPRPMDAPDRFDENIK